MGCSGSQQANDANAKPADVPGKTVVGSHLQSPDDLVNMPHFPEGTKSSCCKFLSKEIWEEYKDKKDSEGVPFKVCIFSGCKNVDSGIGVYAGSHDSYKCFNKYFD